MTTPQSYEDRDYQIEAENNTLNFISRFPDRHPIIAIPTGAGKSKILGSIIQKYLDRYTDHKVLILSHVESILAQDTEAVLTIGIDPAKVGIYSAGLGFRKRRQVTIAGIHSIYKKGELFEDIDLVIIDECHSIPTRGEGMYRKFFESCQAPRIGLTATPFRRSHGYLHRGKGSMFTDICYDLTALHSFNKLVDQGYLCKLIAKCPDMQVDVSSARTTAGDYNLQDLSNIVDRAEITQAALDEVFVHRHSRKKWLIFAIDIEHCKNIRNTLTSMGISAKALHSKMKEDRQEVESEFKQDKFQALVSVGMVTTGFDAPNIDLIVLLRPTKSPVLHIQMVGRGLRISPGKANCLVMDFAGNIERLGPINDVQIRTPKRGQKKSKVPVRKCPTCKTYCHISLKQCPECGFLFPIQEKLKIKSGESEVVRSSQDVKMVRWLDVDRITYGFHRKAGKMPSMKVTYHVGMNRFDEYICYDHGGYAGHKAKHWVKQRVQPGMELPEDVIDLVKHCELLSKPKSIYLDTSQKYPTITNVKF